MPTLSNNTITTQNLSSRVSPNSLPLHYNGPDVFSQTILKALCPDGKMTPSACERLMNFHKKELLVKEKCDLSRLKKRPDNSRIYIIINRKSISSTNYPGLIDKLYNHFYCLHNTTLESYFEIWMEWRDKETSTSKKTIKENRFLWNALLAETEITKVPMEDLTVQDYITYFRNITKDRKLTRKRFNDLKSILNGMLYLAVEQEIIPRNCLRDINYKQFSYKSVSQIQTPYTENERLAIIEHLSLYTNDFYTLAILLAFHLVIRIGELKALKWEDIHGDFILVHEFVNYKNEIIEDIKGYAEPGKRFMPLTPSAKKILEKIKKLNPNSPYIMIRDGQPLATVTFNRRLKKCCEELGIEYRSSHKLRFSTASIMYKNGMSDTELQTLLGHTTLSMTRHYLRNLETADSTASKMSAILG